MTALERLSHAWLAWIGPATWQLALLIGVVTAACALARHAPARLRHALWLIVLAKAFLPPGLATPFSIGTWGVEPVLSTVGISDHIGGDLAAKTAPSTVEAGPGETTGASLTVTAQTVSLPLVLLACWIAGVLVFWLVVAVRLQQLATLLRSAVAVDEGPLRIALEQLALRMKVRRVPDLFLVEVITGPFLCGLLRPRIVVPAALSGRLSADDMEAVLAHEIVHWRRRDTWVGWVQVLAQSLFWFHPLVWWANRQLRHERECACDESVLRLGQIAPQQYGESIVRVLTASRARSIAAGSLVGVFEHGSKLQNRLEDIMSYEPSTRQFHWLHGTAIALFAFLFLPMAPRPAESGAAAADDRPGAKSDAKERPKTQYPQIVETNPSQGATGVDPGLKEISVTFDRDMEKGMSWTGEPPLFPTFDKSRQARWIDARTCVLPVKLEKASYYRLGINSSSFRNFRSSDGVATPPSAIYFCTAGASKAIEERMRIPAIVKLEPENGTGDVDPVTSALRVTFDMPMGEGMSWTGGGDKFPRIPEGKKAEWSNDGRTCTLPVSLAPEHDYELGINSLSHINFQNKWGVPVEPVVYKFHTRAK
jgi:beta-lactamase regulating signal transducer with metallopeptidase domain